MPHFRRIPIHCLDQTFIDLAHDLGMMKRMALFWTMPFPEMARKAPRRTSSFKIVLIKGISAVQSEEVVLRPLCK